MLNLITAAPGSGKTLYILSTVHKIAKEENRQVYYNRIPLTEQGKAILSWELLPDPREWYKLPPGAIIVIDECQKFFPPRPRGSRVPEYISEFETHRHKGFDIYLITQGPKLIDEHIKDIINKHIHLKRIFGSQSAEVLKWDECQSLPNGRAASRNCLDKSKFFYPKEVYGWYESAQLHTHKLQIPKAAKRVFLFGIVAVAALFFSVKFLLGLSDPVTKKHAQSISSASAPVSAAPSAMPQGKMLPMKTPSDVAVAYTPVVPDRPETAPIYQGLAAPTTFPKLAGCVASKRSCKCFTQQATILDVEPDLCRKVAREGRFDPFVSPSIDSEKRDSDTLASRSVAPSVSPDRQVSGPSVVTIADATASSRVPSLSPIQHRGSNNIN